MSPRPGHTPGPWTVKVNGQGAHLRISQDQAWQMAREEDARLISAAPDLLAAAKTIAGSGGHISAENLLRLEDAIAKAEGRL